MFDDDEPDEEAGPGYMGMALVPLLPLSQGKPINGTFQFKQVHTRLYMHVPHV